MQHHVYRPDGTARKGFPQVIVHGLHIYAGHAGDLFLPEVGFDSFNVVSTPVYAGNGALMMSCGANNDTAHICYVMGPVLSQSPSGIRQSSVSSAPA